MPGRRQLRRREIHECGRAPKDGTVLGSLAQTLAFDSALAPGSKAGGKIDLARFCYIGRVVTNIDTGVALPVFFKRGMSEVIGPLAAYRAEETVGAVLRHSGRRRCVRPIRQWCIFARV